MRRFIILACAFLVSIIAAACALDSDDVLDFAAVLSADTITAALENDQTAVTKIQAPASLYCSMVSAPSRVIVRGAIGDAVKINCGVAPAKTDMRERLPATMAMAVPIFEERILSRVAAVLEGHPDAVTRFLKPFVPYCTRVPEDRRERLREALGGLYRIDCPAVLDIAGGT
jgi:hypothetical protein